MSEAQKKKKKRSLKPLLVAGTGIALLSMGASGCFTSGNLLPPTCADGERFDDSGECRKVLPDGGLEPAADAGSDAGP